MHFMHGGWICNICMEQFYWKVTPRDFRVRRSFEKEISFSQKPEIESNKLYFIPCVECIPTWNSLSLISVKNWLLFRNYGELESPMKSLFSKELLHTGMLQFQSPCIECIPIWNSRSLVSVNWFLFRSYSELESLMESLFSKIALCKCYKFSHHA